MAGDGAPPPSTPPPPWSAGATAVFRKAAGAERGKREEVDPANLMPRAEGKDEGGDGRLSNGRVQSRIPVAESAQADLPAHQKENPNRKFWQYPSEAQFFRAMRRKGWDPNAEDMKSVVAIHNAVNERCWHEVSQWESRHAAECPCGPKLKRFQGKPKDYSPKARLLNLLGYKLPFDRHDWVVDRCGREVRYVIDFYNAAPPPGSLAPAAVYLDVRPALDSAEALYDRLAVQFAWMSSMRWMGESTGGPV